MFIHKLSTLRYFIIATENRLMYILVCIHTTHTFNMFFQINKKSGSHMHKGFQCYLKVASNILKIRCGQDCIFKCSFMSIFIHLSSHSPVPVMTSSVLSTVPSRGPTHMAHSAHRIVIAFLLPVYYCIYSPWVPSPC